MKQRRQVLLLILLLTVTGNRTVAADSSASPNLGVPLEAAEAARIDPLVMPDGSGLPAGSGSVTAGKRLYQKYCISCHGENGVGDSADALADPQATLRGEWPEKVIGNYWPYATTLFDFIRRAKPMMPRAGILTDDEVYALTAYLLYLNAIIAEDASLDAAQLRQIEMPNRDGFIPLWKHQSEEVE